MEFCRAKIHFDRADNLLKTTKASCILLKSFQNIGKWKELLIGSRRIADFGKIANVKFLPQNKWLLLLYLPYFLKNFRKALINILNKIMYHSANFGFWNSLTTNLYSTVNLPSLMKPQISDSEKNIVLLKFELKKNNLCIR